MYSTPILLIIFNRPEKALLVFNRIREIKPKFLYIAADGPRNNNLNDIQKCQETRNAILNRIDWPCDVKTHFRTDNIGCKKAVSGAITWFFKNVEEGLILEDDCLPDLSFFHYCKSLLERYRFDNRISLISGNNFQSGIKRGNGSYYFSKYASIWGWASWRRTWKNYDENITSFPIFKRDRVIESVFYSKIEQLFWLHIFKNIYDKNRDTWDHQLEYLMIIHNGLTITPNKNLVTNIGFDSESTRTTNKNHKLANMKSNSINKIIHPNFIVRNIQADSFMFRHVYLSMIISQGYYGLCNLLRSIFVRKIKLHNAS